MSGNTPKTPLGKHDIVLLEHEYDGIREYDQRLPNWWLFTLFGAMAFSVFYWFLYFQSNVGKSDIELLIEEMNRIQAENLKGALAMLDDDNLWLMAANPEFVKRGEKIYQTSCSPCHGKDLEGGIGFRLSDNEWVHGGRPTDIYNTITHGVPTKGMQAWGPVLGPQRIAEAVAYILSHHDRNAMPSGAPPQE